MTLEQAPEDEGYDAAITVSGDIAFQVLPTGAYDCLCWTIIFPIAAAIFDASPKPKLVLRPGIQTEIALHAAVPGFVVAAA